MTCKREWRFLCVLFRKQQHIAEVERLVASRDFSDLQAARAFSQFLRAYRESREVRISLLPKELWPRCWPDSDRFTYCDACGDVDEIPEELAGRLFNAAEHRREGLADLITNLRPGSRVVVASWPGVDMTRVLRQLKRCRKLGDVRAFRLLPPELERQPRLADLRAVTHIEWKTQGIVFLYDGTLIVAKNTFGPIGIFGQSPIGE